MERRTVRTKLQNRSAFEKSGAPMFGWSSIFMIRTSRNSCNGKPRKQKKSSVRRFLQEITYTGVTCFTFCRLPWFNWVLSMILIATWTGTDKGLQLSFQWPFCFPPQRRKPQKWRHGNGIDGHCRFHYFSSRLVHFFFVEGWRGNMIFGVYFVSLKQRRRRPSGSDDRNTTPPVAVERSALKI